MKTKVLRTFFPIIVLGDGKVGKTSLILKTVNNEFRENLLSTVGIDYLEKKITVEGQKIKLKIYDTAGQERFKSIALKTTKTSEGVLLVYSITDESSFNSLEGWIESIQNQINLNKKPLVLLGNKCDVPEDMRKIPFEKGQNFADKLNIKFFECSAKEGINVNEAFDYIAKEMFQIHKKEFDSKNKNKVVDIDDDEGQNNRFSLEDKNDHNKKKDKKKSGCC